MDEEIQMLESYFCQHGEFTKKIEYNSNNTRIYSLCINYPVQFFYEKINVLLSLSITGNDIRQNFVINKNFSLTTTANSSNTNKTITITVRHNDFKSRDFLSSFKKYMLDYIDTYNADEELSLLTICIWIQENLQIFLNQNYDFGQPSEFTELPSSSTEGTGHNKFYGAVIKLDHIRSKKRYFKFLQGTCRNLSLDIELIEVGRLLFLKVISQNEDNLKEFIKRLRTTLVDVDCTGKPCKERMAEVLTMAPLGKKPEKFSIDFKQQTFENVDQAHIYFISLGLTI